MSQLPEESRLFQAIHNTLVWHYPASARQGRSLAPEATRSTEPNVAAHTHPKRKVVLFLLSPSLPASFLAFNQHAVPVSLSLVPLLADFPSLRYASPVFAKTEQCQTSRITNSALTLHRSPNPSLWHSYSSMATSAESKSVQKCQLDRDTTLPRETTTVPPLQCQGQTSEEQPAVLLPQNNRVTFGLFRAHWHSERAPTWVMRVCLNK